jgi:(p)ppGpp synthase/HD superfamily hydrolase
MVMTPDSLGTKNNNNNNDLDVWLKRIVRHKNKDKSKTLEQACHIIKNTYIAKERVSGRTAITHLCNVADVLDDLGMDNDTIIAPMLHELVEDNELSLQKVKKLF